MYQYAKFELNQIQDKEQYQKYIDDIEDMRGQRWNNEYLQSVMKNDIYDSTRPNYFCSRK